MTEELSHFGVKGMHWGVRKSETSSTSGSRKPLTPGQKDAIKTLAIGGATVTAGLLAGPLAATAVGSLGRAAQVATRPGMTPVDQRGKAEVIGATSVKAAKVSGYTGVGAVTAYGAYKTYQLLHGPDPMADVHLEDIPKREPYVPVPKLPDPLGGPDHMTFNPNARIEPGIIEDRT